jgi:hypothetical protein
MSHRSGTSTTAIPTRMRHAGGDIGIRVRIIEGFGVRGSGSGVRGPGSGEVTGFVAEGRSLRKWFDLQQDTEVLHYSIRRRSLVS